MVSYIVDEYANKTHVVIPIDEWLKISHQQKINGTMSNSYDTIQSSYPITHLRKIMHLISGMEKTPVEEWKKQYAEFFYYFDTLKSKDIGFLYLIRNNDFRYLLRTYSEENAQKLKDTYYICSKENQVLTEKDIDILFHKLFQLDEYDFLIFFNENYKHVFNFKKKIRLKAEVKRLFIYDVMETFPAYMSNYYKITKDEAQTKLMKYMYENNSGAKTQVQRALRDADERINHGQWLSYNSI